MPAPNSFARLWYRWKALRLPWRSRFLAGHDLAGNTFWEFKDALNSNRFRRIVKYGRDSHYADIQISPQWHQWLRHTRPAAPTLEEQQLEVSRQAMMKQLAAKADERWKSEPSYLDGPDRQQPVPAIGVKDPGGYAPQPTEDTARQGVRTAIETPQSPPTSSISSKAPNVARRPVVKGGPGEDWQPQQWTGGITPRK